MTEINLHALGLAAKWPELAKLQQDRANFKQRHQKKAAQEGAITAHIPSARELGLGRLRRTLGGGGVR